MKRIAVKEEEHSLRNKFARGGVLSPMPGSSWRSNIAVAGGVIAGFFLALWIGHVAALGPAPGSINPEQKADNRQAEQPGTKPRLPASEPRDKRSSKTEADCKDGLNRTDCLIQLRTAKATERQAHLAKVGLWLVGVTIVFTAVAAGAALWTVSTMRTTAERQLRAYVCLQSGGITKRGSMITASAVYRNSGQTPGYRVRTWTRLQIADFNATPFTVDPPDGTDDPKSIIAPEAETSVSCEHELTHDEQVAVETSVKAIFFWGAIEYDDAFGKERRYFIFNCRMTGHAHEIRDIRTEHKHHGWGLVPHPAGYKAN